MQTHELTRHPDSPPAHVTAVWVSLRRHEHWLTLRFRVHGAAGVIVPPLARRVRADGLWRTTCFELFVRHADGKGYSEFNLSPSGQWAAYDFSAYREGMVERTLSRKPTCTWRAGGSFAIFDGAIPVAALPDSGPIGLSAVIEEEGGVKCFWALAHPAGVPDFHHPTCFAAHLPAPDPS